VSVEIRDAPSSGCTVARGFIISSIVVIVSAIVIA
jgi:hypothetical protein